MTIILALCSQLSFGALNAYFSYAVFDQPGALAYVETYLNVTGASVITSQNQNKLYQGKIEIQWIYRQGDSIVFFDKYNLLSPEKNSPSLAGTDFIDQQRTPLPEGDYELELKILDKYSDHPGFSGKQSIKVQFPKDKVSISDIELLESYTTSNSPGKFSKSGFDIIPLVTAYYPQEINSLKFYTEIYRTKPVLNEEYLVRYFISSNNHKGILKQFASIKKQSASEVNVVMAQIAIDNLFSGNYNLSIEVYNQKNELVVSKQTFFQRSKVAEQPAGSDLSDAELENTFVSIMNDEETLKDNISSLYPISSRLEAQVAENIINLHDMEKMKRYFYSYWAKSNPEAPEASWLTYKSEVEKVNHDFGTQNKKGYETDRGRVYLQYGPPNSIITEEMDPNSRPYTIWHYYNLDHQTNRKFVFYSLGNSANDYQLIHSDAIGELQDPAWELKLHNRTQQFGTDMDQEKAVDSYGSKTRENFQNPK